MEEPQRKTYQHRANSLFEAVDTDGSGTIDRGEFEKLYNQAKQEALEELAKEQELERKVTGAKRRVKIVGCVSVALLGMLAVSVIANCVGMYLISDSMKDTSMTDGAMTDRSTGASVSTASEYQLTTVIDLPLVNNFDSYNEIKKINYRQNGVTFGAGVKSYRWYSSARMIMSLDNGVDLDINRVANSTTVIKPVGSMIWDTTGTTATPLGDIDATTATAAAAACAEVDVKCPLAHCEVLYADKTFFHSIQCNKNEIWNYKDDATQISKIRRASRRQMAWFQVANGVVSFAAGFAGVNYPGQNRIANGIGQLARFGYDHIQDNGCHPTGTIVFDANGKERRIETLAIGDKIMSPTGPTTIVGFLHRDDETTVEYTRITTSNGAITLSPQHMLIVNGELKTASAARVGDVVNSNGKPAAVMRIDELFKQGAYHIMTDKPTYLAKDPSTDGKLEVSVMMLWTDDGWNLEKFMAMWERSKVCYLKGKPFDFTAEWWNGRKHMSKHDAIHCDDEASTALPAP
jgi:hypothetical protein